MSLITTRSSPLTASLKRNRRFISKWLFQIYAVFVETPGIVGIRARWEFFYFFKLKFSDCPCRRSSKDRSTSWSSWGPVVPSLAPSRESAVSLGDTFYTSYLYRRILVPIANHRYALLLVPKVARLETIALQPAIMPPLLCHQVYELYL